MLPFTKKQLFEKVIVKTDPIQQEKEIIFSCTQKNNLCTLQWVRTMVFFLSASHSFVTNRASQTICFLVILQRIQPAEISDKFVLLCCYDESLCIFLLHWLISLHSLGLVSALRDKLDSDLCITMLQPMLRMNLQLNPLTSSGCVPYARLPLCPTIGQGRLMLMAPVEQEYQIYIWEGGSNIYFLIFTLKKWR